MPARNIIKQYFEGGYYHVYNRGVEKRTIFLDDQDCHVFLRYIKLYLSPTERIKELSQNKPSLDRFIRLNLENDVDLLCFALMPNHFHMLLKNKTLNGIRTFMQRLATAYVMYFNNKYKRVGALFQNVYKASPVLKDSYLLQLTMYIHKNASELSSVEIPFMNYCSYPYYLGERTADWLKTEEILSIFGNTIKNEKIAYKDILDSDIYGSSEVLYRNNLTLEDECI